MRAKTEQYQDYIARLFPVPEEIGYRDGKEQRLARTITFQVTDACNLACTYCYQINKAHHVMKLEDAKAFVDMILDADSNSAEYINPDLSPAIVIEFIGGEPLLEIELIDRITDYFIGELIRRHHKWATRYRLSICSNGVLYFDSKVQAYLRKHRHHLSFSISVDGNKELHDACRVFPDGRGSYDLAIAGVQHYTETLGGTMGSKMTIAPQNVSYVFDALKNLIGLGYEEINLNCVYEEGWAVEHARILYGQLKLCADYLVENHLEDLYISMFEENFFRPKDPEENQNWCGGTGYMIAMDWKGDLYPCIRYMESSLGTDAPPLRIGNVHTGIMSCFREREAVRCLQCITRRSQSTDECFSCPIAEGCAWCSAYNYQVFGTPDKRATFICVMHKARALANAYYWNSLYRERGLPERQKLYIPADWALEIVSKEEWNLLKELEES